MPMCFNPKIWTKVLQLIPKQTASLALLQAATWNQTPEILKLAEYTQNSAPPVTSLLQNCLGTAWVQDRSPCKGTATFESDSQGSYSRHQACPQPQPAGYLTKQTALTDNAPSVIFRETPNPNSLFLPLNGEYTNKPIDLGNFSEKNYF